MVDNSSWNNEIQLPSWNKKKNITVGIDVDGDLGFEDSTGYALALL